MAESRDKRWIVIAGNSDSIFRRLMSVMQRLDLASDPGLATNDGRVAHEAMIDGAIARWTGQHDADDILSRLEGAGVPCSLIYSAADIFRDRHFRDRDMLLDAQLPDGSTVAMPGVVPKLSATPGRMDWIGPELGADTNEVLAALGYESGKIARLRREGVI